MCAEARAFLFDADRRRACGYLGPPKEAARGTLQIRSVNECEVNGEKFVSVLYTPSGGSRSVCTFYRLSDCAEVRSLWLPVRASSASVVSGRTQQWLGERLAPVLRTFDGFLVVGGERGEAYVVDLASELLLTGNDNIRADTILIAEGDERQSTERVQRAIELRTMARSESQSNEKPEVVSCVLLLERVGSVLVGFSSGRVELHRVTGSGWPHLERVCNAGAEGPQVQAGAVVAAVLQEPTDDPRAICFITILSAPVTCDDLERAACAQRLDVAVLQLTFSRRLTISELPDFGKTT